MKSLMTMLKVYTLVMATFFATGYTNVSAVTPDMGFVHGIVLNCREKLTHMGNYLVPGH